MSVSIFMLKFNFNSYKNVYTTIKYFLMTAVTCIKATSKSGYILGSYQADNLPKTLVAIIN